MREIDVYIVRIWRGQARFRATARRIDAEEARVFKNARDLARFLRCAVKSDGAQAQARAAAAPANEDEQGRD